MIAIVLRGDARQLPLPDASVDLVVTSPPYFGLRSYTDGGAHYSGQIGSEATPQEWLANLVACTAEWVRVLKPSGSIFVNLGDKYNSSTKHNNGASSSLAFGGMPATDLGGQVARRLPVLPDAPPKSLLGLPWRYAIACTDQLGLILRRDIIWAKPNGLPESVTDRCRSSHEYVFHLVKQPRYYSAVDEIREPHTMRPQRRLVQRHSARDDAMRADRKFSYTMRETPGVEGNPLGKLPGSVWNIPSQPLTVPAHLGIDHFAAFPMELPRRIIRGWSPHGGVVLDPFGGTGTTALVAHAFGRIGISIDRSADYCRLAAWRTTDPGERAKAMRVPKPPSQVNGQADLFAGLGT